ncbi:MAG: lasso peptide biosynthesis PqqD family chaperone [Candidatus Ozemobacteraceae bacterium]
MAFSLETRVVRSDEPVFSKLGDELVMMSIEQSKYFALDETAGVIWECLEKPISIQEICQALMKKFDVPKEQCEQEVSAFLDQLYEKKLITISE